MNTLVAKRIGWIAGPAVFVVALAVLFLCDPLRVPIYPVCAFHRMTGLDCPSCGCLRAMHQLLHGNVAAAMRFNAFLVLSLPIAAALGIRWFWRRQCGERGFGIHQRWMWIYLGAFIAFGILRDLPVPVFAAFAP